MSEIGGEAGRSRRESLDPRAITPLTAMAVLVAVTVVVGAVGYLVLSDASHSTTTTSKSCSTTNVSQCSDRFVAVGSSFGRLARDLVAE